MKNSNTDHSVSYYDVLQLHPGVSDSDVRSAYYKMAKKFHPDKNPQERRLAELRFRLINEAYANLKTQDKRMRYNSHLKKSSKSFRVMRKETSNDNRKTHTAGFGIFGVLSGFLGLKKPSNGKSV